MALKLHGQMLPSAKSHAGTATTHHKPLILITRSCSQILLGDVFLIDTCYLCRIQEVHFTEGGRKDKLKSISLRQIKAGDCYRDDRGTARPQELVFQQKFKMGGGGSACQC